MASGAPALWLYRSDKPAGPGTHLAFRAPSREAVDRFHQAALKAGGRDNGAPGPRPDYSPTCYAAFVIDPDGNDVEAVVMQLSRPGVPPRRAKPAGPSPARHRPHA